MNYQVINQIACSGKEGLSIRLGIAYAGRDQKYSGDTRGVFLSLMRMNCLLLVAHQLFQAGNLLITSLTCASRS